MKVPGQPRPVQYKKDLSSNLKTGSVERSGSGQSECHKSGRETRRRSDFRLLGSWLMSARAS